MISGFLQFETEGCKKVAPFSLHASKVDNNLQNQHVEKMQIATHDSHMNKSYIYGTYQTKKHLAILKKNIKTEEYTNITNQINYKRLIKIMLK